MPFTNTVTRDIGGPGQLSLIYEALFALRATLTPPSVPTLSSAKETVVLPGVRPGDMVISLSIDISSGGLLITALVSAVDTVTVWYRNLTPSTINLPATTLRLLIARPTF